MGALIHQGQVLAPRHNLPQLLLVKCPPLQAASIVGVGISVSEVCSSNHRLRPPLGQPVGLVGYLWVRENCEAAVPWEVEEPHGLSAWWKFPSPLCGHLFNLQLQRFLPHFQLVLIQLSRMPVVVKFAVHLGVSLYVGDHVVGWTWLAWCTWWPQAATQPALAINQIHTLTTATFALNTPTVVEGFPAAVGYVPAGDASEAWPAKAKSGSRWCERAARFACML